MVSAVFAALSLYAVDPSASIDDELPFVFPAHRPASPEMAESPTLTTHGAPTPGPSATAGVAATATSPPPPTNTTASAARHRRCPMNFPPLFRNADPNGRQGKS